MVDNIIKELLVSLGWKYSNALSLSRDSLHFTRPKNHRAWANKIWKQVQFDTLDVVIFCSQPHIVRIKICHDVHYAAWPWSPDQTKQFDLYDPSSIEDIKGFAK